MLHVIAFVTAHPGMRPLLLSERLSNTSAVRAEAGCIEYVPTIDHPSLSRAPTGNDTVVVIEKWESQEALEAHRDAPHMRLYQEKTKNLVARRAVHVLKSA